MAVLGHDRLGRTIPLLPPKGADPRTLRFFPCKRAVYRGPPEGTVIAIVDPDKPTLWWWTRAMPPLWQYFSPCSKIRMWPSVTRLAERVSTSW